MVEFITKFDALALDEQVIPVPKISLDRVSKRCPRRHLRRVVERLDEVPTIISYSSLQQRTSEQIVDIPVPQGRGGRGGHGGLQGVSRDRVQWLRPLLRTLVLVPRISRFKGFSHFSPD